ncbi:hypothetical protein D3C87_2004370 [compost metagenome]
MLYHHGAAKMCFNGGGTHVPPVGLAHIRFVKCILSCQLLSHFIHHKIIGRNRYQVAHLVAAVDVHYLAYRAKPVCRI